MQIDYSVLSNKVSNDIASNNTNGDFQKPLFKTFYPFQDGEYQFRIFFNYKSMSVQRQILRHSNGDKGKIACLNQYAEDCHVCQAVAEVESNIGKDSGVRRKYGYKKQGICFAQIISAPSASLSGDNAPAINEVVLLMYPKSVFDAISNITDMALKSNKIEDLFSKNDGCPFVIRHDSTKGPSSAYSVITSFATTKVKQDDEQFANFIDNLPNLDDMSIPCTPNDEIRDANKVLAQTIKSQYFNSSVVNPNQSLGQQQVRDSAVQEANKEKFMESLSSIIETDEGEVKEVPQQPCDGCPECMGHYDENASRCWLCAQDVECQTRSK